VSKIELVHIIHNRYDAPTFVFYQVAVMLFILLCIMLFNCLLIIFMFLHLIQTSTINISTIECTNSNFVISLHITQVPNKTGKWINTSKIELAYSKYE